MSLDKVMENMKNRNEESETEEKGRTDWECVAIVACLVGVIPLVLLIYGIFDIVSRYLHILETSCLK